MSPSNSVTVVTHELRQEYEDTLNNILVGADEMERGSEKYWWGLWLIRRKNLWRADQEKLSDWLGWWSTQRQGCSVETFYTVTNMVQFCLNEQEMTEEEVRSVILAQWKVALGADLRRQWLQRVKGELKLKPEVEQAIREAGEEPRQVILRMADLGPGEARAEVRRFSEEDKLFVLKDTAHYSESTGSLSFDVRWENETDGLVGIYRVVCSALDVTDGKPKRKKVDVVPTKVAEFIVKRLGVSL